MLVQAIHVHKQNTVQHGTCCTDKDGPRNPRAAQEAPKELQRPEKKSAKKNPKNASMVKKAWQGRWMPGHCKKWEAMTVIGVRNGRRGSSLESALIREGKLLSPRCTNGPADPRGLAHGVNFLYVCTSWSDKYVCTSFYQIDESNQFFNAFQMVVFALLAHFSG